MFFNPARVLIGVNRLRIECGGGGGGDFGDFGEDEVAGIF